AGNPGGEPVMLPCRTTASRAEPTDPATRWTTLMALVACPMTARGRSWKAAAMDGVIVAPSPAPTRNNARASDQYGVLTPIRAYMAVPASASATPNGTTQRAPTLSVRNPPSLVAHAAPSPGGARSTPGPDG